MCVSVLLWLVMISQIGPLPLLHLFPSLTVDHIALLPWLLVEPHCATQAASGFPDSIKKKCSREKEMHRRRLQAFRVWYTRHIVRFFLSSASSIQGEAVLSGGVGTIVRGKWY